MTRIYTRSGDCGQTSLCGGERISKGDLRVECYGQLDALEVALGAARLASKNMPQIEEAIVKATHELHVAGRILSSTPQSKWHQTALSPSELESEIDRFSAQLPPLTGFVEIGFNAAELALHQARVQCRFCERLCVRLSQSEPEDEALRAQLLPWLNRLSDLLFTMSRTATVKPSSDQKFAQSKVESV